MISKDFRPRVPHDKIFKWPQRKSTITNISPPRSATRRNRFTAYRLLTKLRFAGDRKPSLSEWLDLVGKLEADNTKALKNCLRPTTAGGKSREHEDAKSVLHELNRIHTPERTRHVRLLMQWLPAEVHATREDG